MIKTRMGPYTWFTCTIHKPNIYGLSVLSLTYFICKQ